MGRLDHPNIGKLLEAGTTDEGMPFFAMELIDGEPIIRYCDGNVLPIEDRLEIFVDVCRGTAHAHSRLVLHRDLKPSNILVPEVDGRPFPKIIDFGITKGLEESLSSGTLNTKEGLVGTPRLHEPRGDGAGRRGRHPLRRLLPRRPALRAGDPAPCPGLPRTDRRAPSSRSGCSRKAAERPGDVRRLGEAGAGSATEGARPGRLFAPPARRPRLDRDEGDRQEPRRALYSLRDQRSGGALGNTITARELLDRGRPRDPYPPRQPAPDPGNG